MSSNPSTWNTSWKIGAKSGIYTDAEKAYTIYIKYAKQVYSGNDWQETDASEVLPYQFKAAPLTQPLPHQVQTEQAETEPDPATELQMEELQM